MRKVLTRALLFAVMITMSTIAMAQNTHDGALTLTPAVVTLRGTYGQSTTQRLTLTNGTSRDLTFDLFARDVIVRDGKRIFVEPGEVGGSIAATAVFSRNRITLKAGESSSVNVTLTMPANTQSRAVVALFRTTEPIRNGTKSVVPAVGTLLTFRLSDNLAADASPVTVWPQSSTSNASFEQTYINVGKEPLIAKGVVAILDAKGALVGKSSMAAHRLLPSERVRMTSEYAGELAPGKYRVVVTVDVEGQTVTRDAEMLVR
jgi:hypothetical protein